MNYINTEQGACGEESGERRMVRESADLQAALLKLSHYSTAECIRLRSSLLVARVWLIAGWVLALLMMALAVRGSVVTQNFLDAMERVESGMDAGAVGDHGRARGSFQFHAGAWAQVNGWRAGAGLPAVPWQPGAHCRATARRFAFEYCRWLETSLASARGTPPTVEHLYAAWNLGLAGFQRRGFQLERCPAVTRRAAGRVRAMVEKKTLAAGARVLNCWKKEMKTTDRDA